MPSLNTKIEYSVYTKNNRVDESLIPKSKAQREV